MACGIGIAGLLSVTLFLAELPILSMLVIALVATSTLVIGSSVAFASWSQRPPRPVAVEAVSPGEAREAYRAILHSFAEVERAANEATRIHTTVGPALERSRAVVQRSGKMAMLANPLQRYLESHERNAIPLELDRLRIRTETSRDDAVVGALSRAAAARSHQLAIHDELIAMKSRICSRLELVRATLDAFAAAIVKLHVVDEEQAAVGSSSVVDDLDGIGEDLDALASALESDLAA
ncbi:MAG: hypothetical protein KF773_30995 [Deltaproteobacteria bacterium]|nr:hypothetical protein [Deltaproteobacteria bacterium]MCW5803622.1 hypothetical protein [Deltaproteobacteria bacterium]